MKSMTGYAYQETFEGTFSLSVEIKGYNSRYLEIFVNLPTILSGLEPKIREVIAAVAGRGKVETSIRLKETSAVRINREMVKAYADALTDLARSLDLDEKPSLSLLLSMEGVIEIDKSRDDTRYWNALEPVLHTALNRFDVERTREGQQTQNAILSFVDALEESVRKVESFAPVAETSMLENFRVRFAEVLGSAYTSDLIVENRILAETAALLIKCSIAEEISRIYSHLAEFRAETARNPSPGKKLDFLCQELNREVNTIGSKTGILEINREVVSLKDALENIREQLRNVE
jgi:uncharacterized protein (TIGR00255 family)